MSNYHRSILFILVSVILFISGLIYSNDHTLPVTMHGVQFDFQVHANQIVRIDKPAQFLGKSGVRFVLDNGKDMPIRGQSQEVAPTDWSEKHYFTGTGQMVAGAWEVLIGDCNMHLSGDDLTVTVLYQQEDINGTKWLTGIMVTIFIVVWGLVCYRTRFHH